MTDPIELLESTANMLRGMTLDPAIPRHAKEALHSKIAELEKCVEENLDSLSMLTPEELAQIEELANTPRRKKPR